MPRQSRGRLGRLIASAAAALAVGLAACNEETPFEVIEEVTFDPSLGVDLAAMTKLPEGVYIQDRVAGTGPGLAAGDRAWVYYEFWLRDGTPIQSNLFSFVLDVSNVIAGWHVGLEGMAAGGTRLLVIPPELGYGAQRNGAIPPGSILVYEIELDSIT